MIEVAGLRKAYAGRMILDGVDLAVRPGELVALLGPNGAGKTTTVEIVEGYRTADAGSVRVLGVEARRGGPALRARIGLMLQGGAGLEPRATTLDLLRLYAAFHDRGPRADDLLELAGLAAVAGTRVRRLSGGERQRLALAIALAGDPEVLVLDEPTAGMDPEARRETRELVAGLKASGRTILMTTHDLGDVERLADRVAILHRGRLVADASPEALTTEGADSPLRFRTHVAPTPAAVARLRGRLAATHPPVAVVPWAGDATRPRDGGDGLDEAGGGDDRARAFQVQPGRASADLVLELAQWAAREGVLISELRAGATTLEERYFELTGDHAVEGAA